MSATFERITVTAEGVTLSGIVWRRFRRPMPGLIETTLSLAENRGLAKLGAVLPVGTVVTLPVDTIAVVEERTSVRLW